jgi:general secretion pathway protein E
VTAADEQIEVMEPVAVAGLPYGFARRHGVLVRPTAAGGECVTRGAPPLAAMLEVQRLFGDTLPIVTLDDAGFDAALSAQYRDSAVQASDAAFASDQDLAALADSASAVDDLLDNRDDSPVIRLINALLLEAVKEGASDIHVETQEKRLLVRFRIDGVLRDRVEPKRALAPLLVSRIKVMAKLDIAEKRVPQDGRVTLRVGGYDIDARVSTLPTQHGERVVLRLLDRGATQLDMQALGMNARDIETFYGLLQRPHGIVLVTGPTGSGKTTTLYAALSKLNDRHRNIMTVEDPIEYALDGVGQTQVNPKTDMTFARGLRAILRQDPDVIMVGEIRDDETAEVAVRSSMTGHFVLSTLHTNSAIGSVTRLIDMGVERYLLAPMLVGLIAQRLVRRLCQHCRRADVADIRDVALLSGAIAVGDTVYRPVGCAECHGDGYRGRLGLYELVTVDERMQALIHDGASEAALTVAARERGPSLLDDGIAKVRGGLTSVDEVARVVRDDL